MRSSLDKHRDMARSILPSKHRRQAAKAKGVVKRRARHEIRQQLRVLQVHDLSTIDDWDASFNCRAWPDAKISSLVARRRQADKLNHFERWAIAITATLPIEERLGHMAAILPKGLIGDHAISHLVRLPEFDPRRRFWGMQWRQRCAAIAQRRARQRVHLERAVALMLEYGYHRELNAAIKTSVGPYHTARIVRDSHDVASFVAEVTQCVRGQSPRLELAALNAVIEQQHRI